MSIDGKGWITARPLGNYSSLHEFSLTEWMGWKNVRMKIPFFIELDLNMQAPFLVDPSADLAFKVQDADKPVTSGCCFVCGLKGRSLQCQYCRKSCLRCTRYAAAWIMIAHRHAMPIPGCIMN